MSATIGVEPRHPAVDDGAADPAFVETADNLQAGSFLPRTDGPTNAVNSARIDGRGDGSNQRWRVSISPMCGNFCSYQVIPIIAILEYLYS